MVGEMIKFRNLLDQHNIAWHDASTRFADFYIDRVHLEYRNYKFSVINGFGTYGGYITDESKNKGLLELMSNAINGGEPVGELTAEEAIKIVLGGKLWLFIELM